MSKTKFLEEAFDYFKNGCYKKSYDTLELFLQSWVEKIEKLMDIPDKVCCSLSGFIMTDPVVDALGFTYERKNIEAWLVDNDTSPKPNKVLPRKEKEPNQPINKDLIPNVEKKGEIIEFREAKIREAVGMFSNLVNKG